MWQFTLVINVAILILSWLLCLVIIAPVYGVYSTFSASLDSLPILTQMVSSTRDYLWVIPVFWAVISIVWGRYITKQPVLNRMEQLGLHTSLTLFVVAIVVVVYVTATILPLLKIGTILG